VGEENAQTYEEYIQAVKSILKGDIASVRRLLQDQMAQAAAMLDFERAQKFKDQLEALTRHQKKSVIVNQQITDLDVFTLVMDSSGQAAFGNFLRVSQGAVIQSQNVRFRLRIEETPEAILSLFMAEMQAQKNGLLQEVLVLLYPRPVPGVVMCMCPERGIKRNWYS
jgi:excinuclease ABC subunit C